MSLRPNAASWYGTRQLVSWGSDGHGVIMIIGNRSEGSAHESFEQGDDWLKNAAASGTSGEKITWKHAYLERFPSLARRLRRRMWPDIWERGVRM